MIDWYYTMRQKLCKRGKNAESAATVVERRKNSFGVARHGVFRSKVISEYLRKIPCIEAIARKNKEAR